MSILLLKQAGVVHNINSLKTVASLLCIKFWYGMYSRDTTDLIDLLGFNDVHYFSLFQYFLLSSLLY